MGKALTLISESTETKPTQKVKVWRERPMTDDLIFRGTDDCGRSGWFLRLTVSGLYPRRVGPYRTKYQALGVLEEFIAQVEVEPLCNLINDMTSRQAYVVEGVPLLPGPRKTR
jgi:hypothetical protein